MSVLAASLWTCCGAPATEAEKIVEIVPEEKNISLTNSAMTVPVSAPLHQEEMKPVVTKSNVATPPVAVAKVEAPVAKETVEVAEKEESNVEEPAPEPTAQKRPSSANALRERLQDLSGGKKAPEPAKPKPAAPKPKAEPASPDSGKRSSASNLRDRLDLIK